MGSTTVLALALAVAAAAVAAAVAAALALALALAPALRRIVGSLLGVHSSSKTVSWFTLLGNDCMGGVLGVFLLFIPSPDIAPVMVGARRQRKGDQNSIGGRYITMHSLAHLQYVKDL